MAITLLCVLPGCGGPAPGPDGAVGRGADSAPPDTAPYDTHLPMEEFMGHVMQHAADGIWKWQGVVLDKAGEHSLEPKSDEDWEDAESGALALAETTNLLLLPGRRVADPGWDNAVGEVRKLALKAADAAEKHDSHAFQAAGDALDKACDVCHVRYDPNFVPPP